ncbi:Ig-like domain repeat protein [Methanobrevibacter millerae]|nr:Ig-like domain repeat protein [Methanobrevibacter millerae]
MSIDNSDFPLKISNTEDIHDEIIAKYPVGIGNTYYNGDYKNEYGDYEYNDSYYDYTKDSSIDYPITGVYHGPYVEPGLVIKEFNISAEDIDSNNYVTINVKFNGTICSNIFSLERYPVKILENDKIIGIIAENTVSNTDYPRSPEDSSWSTLEPNYAFTTSFKYKLKDDTTELRLILCSFSSNTLVFHGLTKIPLTNLNENSIRILNNNKVHTSNSSWLNNVESLNKALELVEENGTIILNNTDFYINSKININKNISIIGNNVTINALENPEIFEIISDVKLTNITFKNASDYMLNIKNVNCILENCIFTQTNGKIINNTGNLKIINSSFKDIDGIKTFNKMKVNNNTYTLIYNQNTIEIKNTTYANIKLPRYIELDNQIVNSSYLIYNLKNSLIKIDDSNYNNVSAKIIHNDGSMHLKNTNITNNNIELPILKTTSYHKKLNNTELISSYIKTFDPSTITGLIDNSCEMNISNCNIENLTWVGKNGTGNPLHDSYYIFFYIKNPYEVYGVYGVPSTSFSTKAGAIYNTGKLNINTTTFKNLKATNSGAIENEGTLTINNTLFENTKSDRNGGAITNKKTLTVENTLFNHTTAGLGDNGDGGAIYTTGNATINKSNFTYCEGTYGQAIVNYGNIAVNGSIFDRSKDNSRLNRNGGVLYNGEDGTFTLTNSVIENTRFKQSSIWPTMFYGVVINEGDMTLTRNVFNNNTPTSYQNIIGTYNLYNTGKMNATFNIFTNTMRSHYTQTTYLYAFNNNNGEFYMNHNYFDYNKDPYKNHTNMEVNQFFVLNFEPNYMPLEIGENTTLKVTLKQNNGKFYSDYSKLPEMNIILDVNGTVMTKKLVDGETSININNTQNKGTYYVTAYYGEWNQTVQIDIGKENSSLEVEAEEIYYGDDAKFYMTVTGNYTHQPTGNITIIVDGKEYTAKIKDTKAELTIPGMIPKTYDLVIRYEGDEDYFKAFFHENYTVHKYPTQMNISIEPIYYGQNGVVLVSLSPSGFTNQAYMYVTGQNQKTVYVRDGSKLPLKNFAAGEYNVTIVTWDHSKYEACNASAVFIVKKYETNLTVNTSDIMAGETAYLNITLAPEGEVAGEANLTINNKTETIYLKNGNNTVKLENLTGGSYNITIFFPGDKKYSNSSANTVLNVKKHNTTMDVTVEEDKITVKVNPSNATGTVNLYINDQLQQLNLTNGTATFAPNYNRFNNSIFVYYEGDDYYNYTTFNATYENNKLANLTGYDVLTYDGESGTIYVTLTDESGYGIFGKNITISINNKKYTHTTNQSGIASLTLTLPIGNYTITSKYDNYTAENTFTVLKNINMTTVGDIEVYDNERFQYYVKLTDGRNNNIKNAEVTFTVNGQKYINKTNNNGIARIFLTLNKGNYTITAKYKTETLTNKINVRENDNYTLTANDLEMYYRDGSAFNVTLKDGNDNTLSGRIITFTINNNTYQRTTDKNGVASIQINLAPGKYEIKTTYIDTSTTNKILIKDYPVIITGEDVEMYYRDGTNYTVSLKDTRGIALTNVNVIFTVDGENYTRTTNKDGIASIAINLPEGTYTITATYKNASTTNKIVVKDYAPVITGNDVEMYYRDGTNYTITLKNTKGAPLINVDVTFTIDGENYTRSTNSQGIASITINLPEGTYTITATYKNASTTNKIVVKDYEPVITGSDIEMYYRDGTNYTITLKNTQGTPISNADVIFNINNRNYTRITDSNGIARITINLPAGTYTIKATYKNASTTNKVTVKDYEPVITGIDVEMYYRDGTNYTITLKNSKGDILSNKVVTFNVDGDDYNRTTNSNGEASVTINLPAGTYTIKTTYKNVSTTNRITVKEYPPVLTTEDLEMYFHDNSTFKATLTNTNGDVLTNRKVTFTIGNETYTGTTNNQGVASIAINLAPGNYTIKTAYQNLTKTNNIEIRTNYNLETKDLVMIYKDGSRFTAKLTDKNGNTLKNATVLFTINGQLYTRKTNDEGIASIAINLNSGIHTITTRYQEEFKTNNITIKATVEAKDVVKVYRNATQYYAKFTDNAGKVLKNTQVTFNINGVYYTRTTNESGVAKLNLNLQQGKYILTAINPITGENAANNITILPTITENRDITKYYKNATQYTVKLIKPDGSIAGAGEKVTFNINGVYYERTTNESGIAKMNINLNPGDYIITAEYAGCKVSNNIKVLPTIKAQDLTKKYGVSSPFTATLLDGTGKALANEKVTFNINGVFYTRTTDADGIAKLNINLQAGKYIITSSYNGLNVANTVTVQS